MTGLASTPSSTGSALATLGARLAAGELVIAGASSGTSADGIDVALVRTRAESGALAECAAFEIVPFEPELAARLRAVLDGAARPSLGELAALSRDLGRAFGRAVAAVARRAGLEVGLVGSHGQTVWHHDGHGPGGPATMQLGDGDFVAEEAGAPVVSDFRQRDIAAGGEGAPIVALVDELLFPDLPRPTAILNLGGIANLTVLPADPAGALFSFDTGPGCSLLDGLARRFLGGAMDRGGAVGLRGAPRAELLAELLGHPFFARRPPKSTGRDTFGAAWVADVAARAAELDPPLAPADLLATAAELTAAPVARALAELAPRAKQLAVAGGGVHNAALLRALGARCAPELRPPPGLPAVAPSSAFGVDPDAREALGFALLAAAWVLGRGVTRRSATGARDGRILGKLSP